MASVLWMPLLLALFFALCHCSTYDDGTIKASLAYEYDDYSKAAQQGRAVLTLEALGRAKGHPLLSLTSVLDVSESMDTAGKTEFGEKTRLEFLKLANRYIVDRLANQPDFHKFGSVAFSTNVRELTPLQTVRETTATSVKSKIEGVWPNGYTNLYGGVVRGIQQQRGVGGDYLRVVVLFTDGIPTTGDYLDAEEILGAVSNALEKAGDVVIHVIATGEDINYKLLKDIARIGGGIFYHVTKDSDIPRAYAAVLGSLLTESALNTRVVISPVGGTTLVDARLNGADVKWEGDKIVINVGDLLLGERRRVVILHQLGMVDGNKDGLGVIGSYQNAVTRQDVNITLADLHPKRVEAVTPRNDITPAGTWDFRYDICLWLLKAIGYLEDYDIDSAAAEIFDVKTKISNGKYKDEPYFKLLLDDLITYYNYLTRDADDSEDTKNDIGMLYGLIVVIGGGRPSSVDDNFKIVTDGESPLPSKLVKEIDHYAKGEKPMPMFELEYDYGVNYIGSKGGSQYLVQLTLEPPPITTDVDLSLTVVVDCSGKKPFSNTINTLTKLMLDLKKQSQVSLGIVLTSGSQKTVLDLTKATDIDVDDWSNKIKSFKPGGETALDQGIAAAIDQQLDSDRESGSHAVFVITDGSPTDGDSIVRKVKRQLIGMTPSIHLYTFGFKDSDGVLLKDLSSVTDGRYHSLYYPDDIGPRLGHVVWGLLKVGARKVEIEARPAARGIDITNSLPGLESKQGKWTYTFPDIHQGEKKTIIMSVNAPSRPSDLLEVKIQYMDVLKPGLTTHETFTIKARNDRSKPISNRRLDQNVVDKLRRASRGGLTQPRLSYIVDVIYRLIHDVSNDKDAEKDYKADLLTDLEMIVMLMDAARKGTENDIEEAEWTLYFFLNILENQRYPGSSGYPFRIQERYVDPVVRPHLKMYRPATRRLPKVPLADPFEIAYDAITNEVTTDRQTVDISIKLKADDIADKDLNHASQIFVVDATRTTTSDELTKAQLGILSRWRSVRDCPVVDSSYVTILAYGNGVSTLLDKKLISDVKDTDIKNAFEGIKPAGEGGFKSALIEAVSTASNIRRDDPKDDVNIVFFVGDSIKTAQSDDDVDVFVREIKKLDYPVTFVPIFLKKDLDVSFLKRYPAWVQLAAGNWLKHSTTAYQQPIVKRLVMDPNVAPGVRVINIPGSLKTNEGYMLPDLFGSETRTITLKLMLPTSSSSQILRMPKFAMWDMRTQKNRDIRGKPLSITRTSRNVILDRIDLEKAIKDAIDNIDKKADNKDWDGVLFLVSNMLGRIDESSIKDDRISLIRGKLYDIGSTIYTIIGDGGRGDPRPVKDKTNEIRTILVIEKEPVKPVYAPGKDPSSKPFPSDMPYRTFDQDVPAFDRRKNQPAPPTVIARTVLQVPTTKNKAEIVMQIKAPRHNGELIDARAVILMDVSSNADRKHQAMLVLELLNTLAKRRGKRSVEIWGWSDDVTKIFSEDDFGPQHVIKAKNIISVIDYRGKANAAKVLEHIESIRVEKDVIAVVYWIAASSIPKVDATTLEDDLAMLRRHTTKTVMTFKVDNKGQYPTVMKKASDLTGGWSFLVQSGFVTSSDIIQRIRDAAWNSVGWIERAYAKNFVMQLSGKNGAVVSKIVSDNRDVSVTNKGLTIPVLSFGDVVDFKVIVDLNRFDDKTPGNHDVLTFTTEYIFVRMPSSRQLNDERSAVVELVAPQTAARIRAVNNVLDDVGTWVLRYLGRNQVEQALVKIRAAVMQSELSGLKDCPEIRNRIGIYKIIGDYLKQYLRDRTNYLLLQKVIDQIAQSPTENKQLTPKTVHLRTRHRPLSLDNSKRQFRPEITIEIPSTGTRRPGRSVPRTPSVLTIAAVLDAADYNTRIDGEMPVLMVQKMAVRRLMRQLVGDGNVVNLQILGSSQDRSDALPVKRFDRNNLDGIMKHMEGIRDQGSPTSLLSSLKMGLTSVQNVRGADRIVVLFSHASSVGLVKGDVYENLLMPYISYPISPVKVLTYIVGRHRSTGQDVISSMTGGIQRNIRHVMSIPRAVRASIENLYSPAVRGVKVELKPAGWYKNTFAMSTRGMHLRGGIVGDIKQSSHLSIGVSMNVGRWKGDRDIFSYAVSYYDPKERRWYRTPSTAFHLRRADTAVVKQHRTLDSLTTRTLNTMVGQLEAGQTRKAYDTVANALRTVHGLQYQDDSLTCSYTTCLRGTYMKLLKFIASKSKDPSAILDDVTSDGCGLQLVVKRSIRSRGTMDVPEKPTTKTIIPADATVIV